MSSSSVVACLQFQRPTPTPKQRFPIPKFSIPQTPSSISPQKIVASPKPRAPSLNSALYWFVKCGLLHDALQLFDAMPHRDTYAWNLLIKGFVDCGLFEEAIDLYRRMESEGLRGDHFTYAVVVRTCGGMLCMVEGEIVHGKVMKLGLDGDVYVGNCLLGMYAENGRVDLAKKLFGEMTEKDLVSWNSMMSGFISIGDAERVLLLLRDMHSFGMVPDRFSLINSLAAVSMGCCLQNGKEIHCRAIRTGVLETDVMVQTSLINVYFKCGKVGYADNVFYSSGRSKENLVTWNVMMDGYASNNQFTRSVSCLRRMQDEYKLTPDRISMINVLPACAQLGELLLGKSIHGHVLRKGVVPDVVLETALLNMYSECGEVKTSETIFSLMAEKNLVTWNSMVAALARNGQEKEALTLFLELWHNPFNLDAMTIATVLPAYAEAAMLREGKQIHSFIVKSGLSSNTVISNSLVFMYAKCGDLGTAGEVFDRIMCKDVITWNVVIMAHAIHGHGRSSIKLFFEMIEKGIKPNKNTFVSLLMSCSISGLIDQGWLFYELMKKSYGIDPGMDHYGCMLDIIGRTGDFTLARMFIEDMPLVPNARIWGSLLTACRKHRNIEMAEYAAKHALNLDHDNTGCYILLAKMYAEAGRMSDAECIASVMMKLGITKMIGRSKIESAGAIHEFVNGDRTHEEANKIYQVLHILSQRTEGSTYDTIRFRLHSENKTADLAATHSVRLAISFGLISTGIGRPVLIRMNTRICEDCHEFAKRASSSTRREIIVGDSKMFHCFREGLCSCGDYW